MDRPTVASLSFGGELPEPTSIDRVVGSRIAAARQLRGVSQQQLAGATGMTEREAEDAERGVRPMSAESLFQIADLLALPIAWFFEGIDRAIEQDGSMARRGFLQLAYTLSADDRQTHLSALSAMGWVLVGQSLARQSSASL